MTRKTGRMISLSLIAIVLVAAMIFSFTVAENVTPAEAKKVVNTTTDSSQITTPFTSVISAVQESVVGLNNYQQFNYSTSRSFGARGERKSVEQLAGTGSGVVIYDKYVLTNYHVVEDASRLTISTLGSEDELACELVGQDEALDIAIVYVPDLTLPAVPLGDSDQLQVGEWAICIGNPLAKELRGTATVGIVSALNREISSTTTTDKYGLKTNVTNNMIQIDAAINSGNSGGGMFNVLGQLMGIPSMKFSNNSYYSSNTATIEGIGLVIPINTAKPLIEEAVTKVLSGDVTAPAADDNSTKVVSTGDKPLLGVTISPLSTSNDYRVYTGQLPAGMQVIEVVDGAPAAAAGIQVNDIIVEVDGVLADTATHVQQTLASHNFGDTISVKVYRAEGMDNTDGEVGEGQYLDFDVNLFEFNAAA